MYSGSSDSADQKFPIFMYQKIRFTVQNVALVWSIALSIFFKPKMIINYFVDELKSVWRFLLPSAVKDDA